MNTITKQAEDRLQKAGINIILDHPFFSVLLLRLERSAHPEIDTVCTDGRELWFNPEWIMSIDDDKLLYVIFHEIIHCVLHHTTRRYGRDPKTWNTATDYAVNQYLSDSGFTPPAGALLEPAWADLSAEEIYAKIYQEPPESPQGGQTDDGQGDNTGEGENEPENAPGGNQGDENGKGHNDPNQLGEVADAPAESPAEIEQMEAEQDIATQQAAQIAKAQGKLPGALGSLVVEVLEPVLNWRDVLREFITACFGKDNQTWNKCNRRFIGDGMYLPGYQSETLPPFVAAFDTSGSVSNEELAQFNGELNSIMTDFPGDTQATALYCDTRITDVLEYNQDQPFGTVKPHIGRGGTSFEPPFEWVEENMPEPPAALIYFTDGECTFPDKEPDYPVLWVFTQKHITAPWGRSVYVDKSK